VKRSLVLGLTAILLSSPSFAAPKGKTFKGEIMDSQCAMNASHAEMLKKEGMGDKDAKDPMVKKMCTDNCVKMGGKYVLYDVASQKVYQLDDQTKPQPFAGQNVKVTGTLEKDTIHVTNIAPGS
jgi:type 1 fimbria pilin